nr:adhesion G-protein coupled receptor G2-like [Onthophagus taurus]
MRCQTSKLPNKFLVVFVYTSVMFKFCGGDDSSEEYYQNESMSLIDENVNSIEENPSRFCFENITHGLLNQTWCETTVSKRFVFPCVNPCRNNDGTFTMRRCEIINGIPTWSKIYNPCNYPNLSNLTTFLSSANNQFSANTLNDVSAYIKNQNAILTELDVELTANILENASHQPTKIEHKESFFSVINNLLYANQSVFKSSRNFGSTDKIIKSTDNFVIGLSEETESYSINLTNVAFELIEPQTNSKEDYFNINFNNVVVKIPIDILNTSMLTTFKSNNLFLEGNVVSDIVDLKVLGVAQILNNTISIYLPVDPLIEVNCSFWRFEGEVGNWSIDGVETIRLSDDLVECRTNHLTAFVLLGISDRIFENLSETNQIILQIISTILCSFSLIGLIIIFITCFFIKKWYRKRINTIQISAVITLEIILIFLNDVITIIDGLFCKFFGITMHYLVLVKFVVMFFIARRQFENFVTVLTSRNRSRNFLITTFIAFSIPIIIVGISAGIFPDHYNSGDVNFCYPKSEAFIYFLIIPIASILVANIIIFSLVMFKISGSISRDKKQKILQTKLAVMLFFMLGLTWIFSVLSHAVQTLWVQLALIYTFAILSPLQGFVIFVFAIVFDSDAKTFWLDCWNKLKYSPLDVENTKNTTSTAILMSSVTKSEDDN